MYYYFIFLLKKPVGTAGLLFCCWAFPPKKPKKAWMTSSNFVLKIVLTSSHMKSGNGTQEIMPQYEYDIIVLTTM